MVIDQTYHKSVVESIKVIISEKYIEEDKIEEINKALGDLRLELFTETDNDHNLETYTKFLSKQLKEITGDLHFAVFPTSGSQVDDEVEKSDWMDNFVQKLKRRHYDIKKIEILDGNIGYFRFDLFHSIDLCREKMTAAMQLLADTSAIIFDMRYNGGGDPSSIQFILSYLFNERKHINTFYRRTTNEYTEVWTFDDIEEYYSQPVYVLTSNYTGSAAEEFSYDLKVMDRAILIGETTAGAAHPVMVAKVNDDLDMYVPDGRPINPITKADWERVGVEPHVKVPRTDALTTAHEYILEQLIGNTQDDELKQYYLNISESLGSNKVEIVID